MNALEAYSQVGSVPNVPWTLARHAIFRLFRDDTRREPIEYVEDDRRRRERGRKHREGGEMSKERRERTSSGGVPRRHKACIILRSLTTSRRRPSPSPSFPFHGPQTSQPPLIRNQYPNHTEPHVWAIRIGSMAVAQASRALRPRGGASGTRTMNDLREGVEPPSTYSTVMIHNYP